MEEPSDSIVEARKELMVSPSGGDPTPKRAHFIKPTLSYNETLSIQKPQLSFPASFNPKSWPLKVKFNGWRYPPEKWESWVNKMAYLHKPTWEKAGIFEAILNSRYKIIRNDNVVLGLAEKWCDGTKSFIFPWGEATISLEDVTVLGGFSVLGFPVFKSLETEELKEIEEDLDMARRELNKTPAKKASQTQWLLKFMDSGSDIEHEAFLTMWLSRFVFPSSWDVIVKRVFPMAIHLARGERMALAPAVLAHIYKELTVLKDKIVAATKLERNESDEDFEFWEVTLWSPFQLVQVWVWERFMELGPKPNVIETGEPWLAQWHDLKCKAGNVRTLLDSSKKTFSWRPYVRSTTKRNAPKLYAEEEILLEVGCLKDELLDFAQCVKVSQLVGLDCVVQYLPNRVALQFGMDQDIPGNVPSLIGDPEIAWDDYARIGNGKMFIPSRFLGGDFTMQYLEWWGRPISKCSQETVKNKNGDSHLSLKRKQGKDGLRLDSCTSKRFKESAMCSKEGENDKYHEPNNNNNHKRSLREIKELNDSPFPPGFLPKCNKFDAKVTPEEDKMSIKELVKLNKRNRKVVYSSKKDQSVVTEKVILVDDDDLDGSVELKAAENFYSPSEDRLSSLYWKRNLVNLDEPTFANEAASDQELAPPSLSHKFNFLEPKEDRIDIGVAYLSRKEVTKVTDMVLEVEDDDFIEGNGGKKTLSSPSASFSVSSSRNKRSVDLKQPNVVLVEEHGDATGNIKGEEGWSSSRFDLPELEIEVRIMKLERLVAKIKAATSSVMA